ncbi:MAG: DUF4410 domain-containing protein [Acidobacteriota bacterium]|nr:DUF4410 domain-containing protein [Acidobacteriota bacterium]
MKSLLFCALVALIVTPALQARSKPAPTAPGKYKEWGPNIDQIEIVKTFKLGDYNRIVVMPFDTSATPLPEKSEKSYETIKSVLAVYSPTLAEALKPELKAKLDVDTADKTPKSAKTLIVRGNVVDLSPGSRAKRYLAGYGAGAAGTKLNGEIVDAATGQVLLRFTQERRSGGTFKFGGGNDMDVMRDSIHAEGQDIAHMLDAF